MTAAAKTTPTVVPVRPWARLPFWDRVRVAAADECWPWRGHVNKVTGYGVLSGTLAHRAAYELAVGPIPDGLTIDHLCRTRTCCNPAHMEPVTREENSRRGERNRRTRSGGGYLGKRTHCKNGHEFTPENTRMDGRTRLCRTCARDRLAKFRAKGGAR